MHTCLCIIYSKKINVYEWRKKIAPLFAALFISPYNEYIAKKKKKIYITA